MGSPRYVPVRLETACFESRRCHHRSDECFRRSWRVRASFLVFLRLLCYIRGDIQLHECTRPHWTFVLFELSNLPCQALRVCHSTLFLFFTLPHSNSSQKDVEETNGCFSVELSVANRLWPSKCLLLTLQWRCIRATLHCRLMPACTPRHPRI